MDLLAQSPLRAREGILAVVMSLVLDPLLNYYLRLDVILHVLDEIVLFLLDVPVGLQDRVSM